MAAAIEVLKHYGATVIDPADIPSVVDPDPGENFLLWNICRSLDEAKTGNCSIDFAYGMERDFNLWLASLGPAAPIATLTELRQWNRDHQKAGTLKYGQALLDFSDAMDLEVYRARYEADRAKDLRLTATHGIDEVMATHRLDALLFPGVSGANLAARPGYPTVMVPFGTVTAIADPPFPEGFDPAPVAARGQLHRHCLQRAASPSARLQLRAGDAHAACHRPGCPEAGTGGLCPRRLRRPTIRSDERHLRRSRLPISGETRGVEGAVGQERYLTQYPVRARRASARGRGWPRGRAG